MANEVATREPVFGNVVKSANLAKALKKSADKNPRTGSGGQGTFLNFSGKRGLYSVGTEGKGADMEQLYLVNIAGFEDGWICWKGGKPVAKRLANINEDPVDTPDMNEMGPFDTGNGEGWHMLKAFQLKGLDDDEQFYFSNNSVSGVAEIATLIEAVVNQIENEEPAWPIIELSMEQFSAKGHKNFKPVFKVYGWVSDESLGVLFDPDSDIDEVIAASAGSADESASEEAPVPSEGEQPSRRRRRKL